MILLSATQINPISQLYVLEQRMVSFAITGNTMKL